ncbi:sn-1-specific diacylglycerol lipase ABHD11-like [Dermacentor andersoni]|uniref:sn-1-specific diacylglycerol lipase ABHD11-like n=1 Tax=Dermacentor andersoni TaxID=34620 RepID=UPI003B3B33B4
MEHILSLLSPDMSLDQALQLADEYLSREVTKPYVRSYLLANLRKGPLTYEWQPNLKVIRQKLEILCDAHYLNNQISHVEALFISADRSVYITDEDAKAIKQTFPEARVVTIKGANHWVYNDKREEFVDLVRDFMTARRPESAETSVRRLNEEEQGGQREARSRIRRCCAPSYRTSVSTKSGPSTTISTHS